jgi:hypothetical protein
MHVLLDRILFFIEPNEMSDMSAWCNISFYLLKCIIVAGASFMQALYEIDRINYKILKIIHKKAIKFLCYKLRYTKPHVCELRHRVPGQEIMAKY